MKHAGESRGHHGTGEPNEGQGERFAGKRILVVDDDASVREMLSRVLVGEGYRVLASSNGAAALAMLAGGPIDLVLLDLKMPGQDGWDTFEQLTTHHSAIPVIIITARSNQLFTALGAGVGALLEKPLDFPTLLQTVGRLLAESPESRQTRVSGQAAAFYYNSAQAKPRG